MPTFKTKAKSSIEQWLYWSKYRPQFEYKELLGLDGRIHKSPYKKITPVHVARIANNIIKRDRFKVAQEVANLCGYDLVHRKDVTDYQYKNCNVRYMINGKSYCLLLRSQLAKGQRVEKLD
jgi:hypothetical protein